MKSFLVFIWEILKIVIIALLIVLPIRYFIFQPFIVRGESMEPNFHHGDYLIIDQISYRLREPERGEVIVFKYPNNHSVRYIKRVIGLPGEIVEIKDGQIFIYNNDQEILLEESNYLFSSAFTPGDIYLPLNKDEYFVLGDNRNASADSRRWGALPREDIIGRTLIRAWPFNAFAMFESPQY